MMTMPTNAAAVPAHPCTERAQKHKDGSVLLSISEDRICKLNGVGALTWMVLEESREPLSVQEVVQKLNEQFTRINSEGELLYQVSLTQLREDTVRFLTSATRMNLLQVITDSRKLELYRINEGVSGTTSASTTALRHITDRETKLTHGPSLPDAASSVSALNDVELSIVETITAFIGLAAFDLLLKFAGFKSLIRAVKRRQTTEPRTTDREICRRVRAMVDRAQMYYPKKAMCLQHSAVVTWLLRRRGVPAEMVLAACDYLPEAHAWVEVDRDVVNDSANVKESYRELYRA
jgi:hypothetical protein